MRRKRANISRGMLFAWGMGIGLLFLFAVPQRTSDRIQLTYARVFRWPLAAGDEAVGSPGVPSLAAGRVAWLSVRTARIGLFSLSAGIPKAENAVSRSGGFASFPLGGKRETEIRRLPGRRLCERMGPQW